MVSSGVNAGINGGDFEDALVSNLRFAGLQFVGANLDKLVGDQASGLGLQDGHPIKIALHAGVGAGLSAIGGGDPFAGAVAGGVSEALSPLVAYLVATDTPDTLSKQQDRSKQEDLSRLIGAVAAAFAGGNGEDVYLGAEIAGLQNRYNRQLHTDEIKKITEMAGGDEMRKALLTAAACALVHCSAEFAIGSPEYERYAAIEKLGNSADLAPVRDLLAGQPGLFRYTSTSINADGMVIGGDAGVDALKRFNNTYGVTTRSFGALQAAGGGAAVFTGGSLVAGGAATCWFGGSGCVAAGGGLLIGGWGGDQFQAGIRAAWTGEGTSTLGGQLLQQTGLSPVAAEFLYGLAGIGGTWALSGRIAAVDASVAYRGLTAAEALALRNGEDLVAKAPYGTWTATDHILNFQPNTLGGAAANSPWISTSRSLEVAKFYGSNYGVVAIDLSKVPSNQIEVWRIAPRVPGIDGLAFQRSFWGQEVTIYQRIPNSAVIGPVP